MCVWGREGKRCCCLACRWKMKLKVELEKWVEVKKKRNDWIRLLTNRKLVFWTSMWLFVKENKHKWVWLWSLQIDHWSDESQSFGHGKIKVNDCALCQRSDRPHSEGDERALSENIRFCEEGRERTQFCNEGIFSWLDIEIFQLLGLFCGALSLDSNGDDPFTLVPALYWDQCPSLRSNAVAISFKFPSWNRNQSGTDLLSTESFSHL